MILCVGTTPAFQRTMIFGRLKLDAVNRAAEVSEHASGKSVNVARVLRTLGEEPLATGFLGGARGDALRHDLDASGIAHDFVTVSAATRQCVTVIDRATGGATELVEESAAVDEQAWWLLDAKLRTLLPKANVCVFSGSLPPGAPDDFYARWLPLALQHEVQVILDARGEPLRRALGQGPFTIKVNRDELLDTLGARGAGPAELRAALRQVGASAGFAIATHGADATLASDGDSIWEIHTPRLPVVSAIGSGDAFAAGLSAGLARSLDVPARLTLAAACAAANALTPLTGHVRLDDVHRLSSSIEIRKIEDRE